MIRFLVCLVLIAAAGPAWAADFYAGKTISIYSNTAEGVLPNLEARVVAENIGRYIPGHPTVILRSKPGGAYVLGANYLADVAPRDGTALGYMIQLMGARLFDTVSFSVDPFDYQYVATTGRSTVTLISRRWGDDIVSILRRTALAKNDQDLPVWGLITSSKVKGALERMGMEIMGVRFRTVSGYASTNEMLLEIRRGALDFHEETASSYFATLKQDYVVDNKVLLPLWQTPSAAPSEVPSIHDVYWRTYGHEPGGALWAAYRELDQINANLGTSMFFMPGVPAEATQIMREAFTKLLNDEQFKDGMTKLYGSPLAYQLGNRAVEAVRRIDPSTLAVISAYISGGRS